jgi:hypothetical protein
MSRWHPTLFNQSVVTADWPAEYANQFWRAYPRRVAKKPAMEALERLRRSGDVTFTALLAAVERYAESVRGTDPKYVCHASTWLNQERWTDETEHLGNTHGQRKVFSAERWAADRRAEIESKECTNRPRLVASHTRSSG